ncbi:MAG: hypothetical protein GY769_12125, partial [bacterium]|nr:hypothetical protein [bacterium]
MRPRVHSEVAWIGVGLVCLTVPAAGQLYVSAPVGASNTFDGDVAATRSPLSGAMSNGGDVWVEHDLELGGELYLRNLLYMHGEFGSGGDVDQWIYFYDDDDWDDEHFGWKEADERFELSNSLAIQANPVEAR